MGGHHNARGARVRSPTDGATVARFRDAIARGLGLQLDDGKLTTLAELLERRSADVPAELYLRRLADPTQGAAELRELARELTVGETYFFRHAEQFRAFADAVIPERMSARGAAHELRVLCAGCASGDEAYSLAILLLERAPGWNVSVRAVDVNPAALEKAARARYTAWSLRETPVDVQARYFVARGRDVELDATVRAVVTFDERNLSRDDGELWRPNTYDVVFCRNVLMYFAPEVARAVVARIHDALSPGGYLFLGHAETLRSLSTDFHLRHTHDAFYYQRKDGPTHAVEGVAAPPAAQRDPVSLDWSTTWLETVQRSSEKIRALTDRRAIGSPPSAASADQHRRAALALLAEERFDEALERLDLDATSDAETLLIRAVLLAQRGRAAEAETTCQRLLSIDELSAGAHYVLALCREGAGDHGGAADHDLTAAYLDPSFAMPRLHLGLMARRNGDRESAQRELEHASLLLQREESARILLFGGGFGRDALIALCRAELGAAGGRT